MSASGDRPAAWLRWGTAELDAAGVPSPRADAETLLASALGVTRAEVRRLVVLDADLPEGRRADFARLVDRRAAREPLQHILGAAPFRHLELAVGPGVFVPRPETEVVAQVAIDEAERLAVDDARPLVVDLCCGAGGIALAVDTEVPASRVVAVDLAPEAVALTRRNDAAVGTRTMRIEHGDVRDSELLADLDGTVDVVVSNPPYIPPDAEPTEPEVRDHDPDLALYGGGVDGLDVPRAVVLASTRLLRAGGLFVMEHAEVQAAAVREVVTASGAFDDAVTLDDLTGRPRAVVARRR
ncbi:modification methylase, HemK family [Beutenbergia cavernae DSM 12333]|uniref:Release factor glutamine methyltransferase n=1 Tax=Beutenbergia cavernae (strain ATCC BAA-8 / DSM 12333 / CCUG 43141 / JCM 11478 / NBRC 16432 / NCIMB 13614 / HKI 0122) TaxID=471853 RepID=C5C1S9_BEUC1|nr:peptide chain release factor N(5)-glutamine methyltransferase [Beutenbergia cavernae]ACQ79547.1 modification methylase, HemK family [Beutenbergia cavernae DSM 12333]